MALGQAFKTGSQSDRPIGAQPSALTAHGHLPSLQTGSQTDRQIGAQPSALTFHGRRPSLQTGSQTLGIDL